MFREQRVVDDEKNDLTKERLAAKELDEQVRCNY